MNTEQNKEVVKRLFAAQAAGDMATVSDLIADEVIWSQVARSKGYTCGKEETLRVMQNFHAMVDGKWEKEIVGMTAEGSRVAVEAVGHVKLRNGKSYSNLYHFLFVIEEGRIKVFREYLDTLYSAEVFGNTSPADPLRHQPQNWTQE